MPRHEWRTGPARAARHRCGCRSRAASSRTTATTSSPARRFVAKCGSCHTLARAGTTGVTGPNLDEAFQQARASTASARARSRASSTARSCIPARTAQIDPQTGKPLPRDAGQDRHGRGRAGRRGLRRQRRRQARRGQRPARRRRRQAVQRGRARPRAASSPSPPTRRGALAYKFGSAEAPAGALEIDSKNESLGRPQHRDRGQRRQREGRGRQERRRVEGRPPTSRPASTRSTAPSRATARAAWRASSPSSRRAGRRAASARLVAVVLLPRAARRRTRARRP